MKLLLIYLIFAFINSTFANIKVISVPMGIYASEHALKLTQIINNYEKNGYIFINSDVFNSVTYIYLKSNKDDLNISENLIYDVQSVKIIEYSFYLFLITFSTIIIFIIMFMQGV